MKLHFIVLLFFLHEGEPVTHSMFAESLAACHQAGAGAVLEMRQREAFDHPAYSCHAVRAPEPGQAL